MKHLFTTLLLFWCLSPLPAQVLQLDFDNPGKDPLPDLSSHKHQVNTYGGLQYIPDRFGIDCRAALFTGNQIVEVIDEDRFEFSDEFTAMAWMKLPDSLDFQWITLVCKGLESNENRNSPAFRVQMTSQTVSVNTSSTKEIDEVAQDYPTERWFHFATTFDRGKITLYVDGRRYKYFVTDTQLGRNNHSLTIGYDVPGDTEYFIGAMDDFYLLPTALSASEIRQYMDDERNKNLKSDCPVNPQKFPPKLASSDPWDTIEIDDFDESTPVNPSPLPSAPSDPWSGVEIDDPTSIEPDDHGVTTSIPPGQSTVKTPAMDPDPIPPAVDPWEDIAIDELDPVTDPIEMDSISNTPGNSADDIPDPLPKQDTAEPQPDEDPFKDAPSETGGPVGDPFILVPPKMPLDSMQTPEDDLSIPADDPGGVDDPVEQAPTLPPVSRDSLSVDLSGKKELDDDSDPRHLKPVSINPVIPPSETPDSETPATVPSIDIPTERDPTGPEEGPEMVFELDSLDVGRKMILDKIEFARHSHHLNDRSKQVLSELAEVLQKNPDFSILLEGHTEADGNYEANMTLSKKRAEACKRFLIKRRKIKPSRIETKYYGPERPLTEKQDVKWKNRRVEVTVF